jgi:hypothetical protein
MHSIGQKVGFQDEYVGVGRNRVEKKSRKGGNRRGDGSYKCKRTESTQEYNTKL